MVLFYMTVSVEKVKLKYRNYFNIEEVEIRQIKCLSVLKFVICC